MAGEILKCLDSGALLEKLVGKRQSIIFALLISAFAFVYWGETEIASVLIGGVMLIVNDYIKDVNEERTVGP